MESEPIEVTSKLGKIKGLVKKSEGTAAKTYYSFQGIRYGQPPVGDLRFKAPVPYGKWEGVYDATKEGNCSLQKHILFSYTAGSEDCLFLNVYTSQMSGEEGTKRAVMVWIHGGGFARGSGSTELFGPDYLIEEDIVLVTINYRCGALGFLSMENEDVPGNAGLKDQVLALQWVRDNIASFGGDSSNVTIFGESAGAAAVHFLMLSPLSRGLFHRAIIQSGSSLCPWAFQIRPRDKALQLASQLGCTSLDEHSVLDFLRSVPAEDILEAQEAGTLRNKKENFHNFSFIFSPSIEVAGDKPFLSDYPSKIMEKGEFSKVPVMIGLNDKEGMLTLELKGENFQEVNNNISLMVPQDVNVKSESNEEKALSKKIFKFYFKNNHLSWDDIHGYIDFMTDVAFAVGIERTRRSFQKFSSAVYSYMYTYTTSRTFSPQLLREAYPEQAANVIGTGASHGDELFQLFKTNVEERPVDSPNEADTFLTRKLIKAWTTFAKTGNPNSKELHVTWKQDSIEDPSYLEIGNEWKTVNGTFFPEREKFWSNVYEKFSYSY